MVPHSKLYDSSHPSKIKLTPKLTDRHIHEKPFGNMKVKFATQIFSNSVAVVIFTFVALGVLPGDATFTGEFLEKVEKLSII